MSSRAIRTPFAPVLSAVLLYLFAGGFTLVAALVMPWIVDLVESAPRLGVLALLALFTSPIAALAVVHRTTSAIVDALDGRSGRTARAASWWAGMLGWFAMVFSSITSALLLTAIFPPPREEPALAALVRIAEDVRLQATLHAALWVAAAALVYAVEAAATNTKGDVP